MLYFLLFFLLAAALFYMKFHRRVPILMYHRIASVPGDRNALPPEKFREQLEYLHTHGYHTISMQALYLHYQHGEPLPSKPVLLSFDDGYTDNFTTALPLLRKFHMKGIVFPISNWIGRENKWENFHKTPTTTMNPDELETWRESGLEIGSHTVNHPFLSQLSETAARNELMGSRHALEENFSMNFEYLCYPYGDFNQATMRIAKESGYKAALAIFDRVPLWNLHLFALPRIPIPSSQPLWEFKLKVSKAHVIFIALRQWERWFKRIARK